MRLIKKRQHATLNLPTLQLEGGLFLPDQLEKAALGKAGHQAEADYFTPKGLKLKDDYSRAFQIASAQWKHFAVHLDRRDTDAFAITIAFVQELLHDALGYSSLAASNGITIGERHYPITLLAGGALPVVVAPHDVGLDDADPRFAITGSGSRKKSAFQLAQEFLNASGDHLWALVSNGKQMRLLRDAATLTRPSFLEFDLQDLLGSQRFAEFAMVWRLLHASRAGLTSSGERGPCIWESWRATGQEEGTRVRDGLRQGVTEALLTLGTGFLQHPTNETLRQDLLQGRLSKDAYFQQLLRLVYRLIFLFTVEERGVLHASDASKEAVAARRAYAEGYALARLRDICLRRRARTPFDDLWSGVRIVFRGLTIGEPRLALPALGGLFAASQCPVLDSASLSNSALLAAVRHLRWASQNGTLAPVDYRNMGPEELGSVYESLLELVPEIDIPARQFGFVGLASQGSTPESIRGNARKTSGSYYTPDSLVQELIKTALDPVIEQRLAENPANPTEALLSIKVVDPACGSGHFLLAAARRLAERLAALRATEGAVKPQDYRHALREVISRCIFGVDRNPMALELARTALWLEGFEEGWPLSFLDHHLQCGDALMGLTDLKALKYGIPKAAFKPLSGDDKEVCKELAKINTAAQRQVVRDFQTGQVLAQYDNAKGLTQLNDIESLPQNTVVETSAKEAAYLSFLQQAHNSRIRHAADLVLGAFLLDKTEQTKGFVPTNATLLLELISEQRSEQHLQKLAAATEACVVAKVLHWPLAFPQVFNQGGFDCVLGNPPWERIKLQEEEFFATRNSFVAGARNKAERGQRIQWLSEGLLVKNLYSKQQHGVEPVEAEQRLYHEFISARRTAEAASMFAHVNGNEGGRYPLTGVGDVNTYALFAETISQITASDPSRGGRAGFIVPTGIATDDSTKAYFGHIAQSGHLASLYDFENRNGLFPAVDSRMKFCLLTLGQAQEAEFAFFLTDPTQLADSRRRFSLSVEDFARINPNSLTCPVFRSRMDAELTRKIYRRVPVLIRDSGEGAAERNLWGFGYMTKMFDMADNSHEFVDYGDLLGMQNTRRVLDWSHVNGCTYTPLYEAKHVHLFDHRWASCVLGDADTKSVADCDKENPHFSIATRYWIERNRVEERLATKAWSRLWLLGWRDICRATDERTVIAAVFPRAAAAHTLRVAFVNANSRLSAAFLGCLSSLALDYVARQKVGGTHLTVETLKQFPVLPQDSYTESDLAFIVSRVLELTYTAHDMQHWAQDLGCKGEPFTFDPDRRAILRAELDAYYARLYRLTRDELRYILDPADVMGAGYPSETFRVLKNNELKQFGEFRTARLVMREFDRMALADEAREPYVSLLVPPPGQQVAPSYSPHGVLRDEDDARLAGLVILLIRAGSTLPRQQFTMALLIAQTPETGHALLAAHEINQLDIFHRENSGMLTSGRLDRVQSLLRFFESAGAIRIEQQGTQITAVPNAAMPPGLIVDKKTEEIAGLLVRAAHMALQLQPSSDVVSETQSFTKRA